MATIKQKQNMIDCLRGRVITIQLSRDDYDEYQRAYRCWDGEGDQAGMEKAYYYLKDDFTIQLQQHGYDAFDHWDEWADVFEYAYLDGANESPVFETHTGEAIKLRFEWF